MELRQMQTFRAVAASLSFTRAAEALSYAQSSVTGQIQSLEEELGVQLFDRLGKRIALTPEGKRFLFYVERILQLSDEAKEAVRPQEGEPSGTIMIGSPESLATYRLPPVLQRFRQRYPKVQLILRPDGCEEIHRTLAEGNLDLAFTLAEPIRFPHIIAYPLKVEPIRVIAWPEHPLAAQGFVRLGDLHGQPLLQTEATSTYRLLMERAMAQAGVVPGSVMEFGSIEAIKQCVAAGMGLSILPAITIKPGEAGGRLVALPWEGYEYHVVTQLSHHRDKWLSPALRAFLEVALEVMPPLSPSELPPPPGLRLGPTIA